MDHTLDRYHRCGSCGYVIGPSEHTGELVGRCPTYCSTDAVTFTPTEITFPAGPSREAIARDTRDVEALIRDKYRELDQANQANYVHRATHSRDGGWPCASAALLDSGTAVSH